MPTMNDHHQHVELVAAALGRGAAEQRAALMAALTLPDAAELLRALDAAGLLTRLLPALEPARHTDQPHVHFLPVLGHSLEAVAAVDWLLGQIAGEATGVPPAAIRANPSLAYRSRYAAQLRAHFAELVSGYPRPALLRLGALLHDVAKPQTKRLLPDGSVNFHEHQSIGGEVAAAAAERLGFAPAEVAYVRMIVREHMRPGQLWALDELTQRAVQRFFFDTDGAGPDVLLHLLADHMATRGPQLNVRSWIAQAQWIDTLLDTIWGEPAPEPVVLADGNDLMRELGLRPGPQIGRLLAAIGEAQADGEIATRDEALALARRLLGQV